MSDPLDVILDVPYNFFDVPTGDLFRSSAQIIISEEMSCSDDSGRPIVIGPVYFEMIYHDKDAHFNTDLIIGIEAVERADRMHNIKDRLKVIRRRIRALPPADKTISLRLTPCRQDCWLENDDE